MNSRSFLADPSARRTYWQVSFFCCCLVVALVNGPGPIRAGGDPDGAHNLAAARRLPQGPGLARAYPGDRGIGSHPAVIFADDFEVGEFKAKWDTVRNEANKVLSLVAAPANDGRFGNRTLCVEATLGENTGGGVTKWFKSAPALFIRFYTYFTPQCDYIHHFCTLRANRSLQGKDRWSGFGGAGLRPAGDERFSTALEPWGNWGRWPAPGRWNFYSYWHTMDRSRDGKFWGNAFRPAKQSGIQKGEWICAEFMLKHNTPGKDNGEQAFWTDGQLRGHWTGINWRTSPTLYANAFTLESYVTDRWTQQVKNVVYFDNVVIAREYIGPTQAGVGRQPGQPGQDH